MSAFGGKADNVQAGRDVCFLPKADIGWIEIPQCSGVLSHMLRTPRKSSPSERATDPLHGARILPDGDMIGIYLFAMELEAKRLGLLS